MRCEDITVEVERACVRHQRERLPDRRPEELWVGYDPDPALVDMRAAAGTWSDVDHEHLKAEIYRAH